MKNKNAKIAMIIGIALLVLVAAYVIIMKPFSATKKEAATTTDEQSAGVEINASIDDSVIEMYKFLLYGKHQAISTSSNDKLNFEFRDDGTFTGYTKAENDDLGHWNLEKVAGKCCLVITTVNVNERYDVDFNNNNDLTLKANDGTIYILTSEENEK